MYLFIFADDSVSWVSAENLWILGRYMVHLSLEEIVKISPVEVSWKRTFTCPITKPSGVRCILNLSSSASQVSMPWKIGYPPQPIYLESLKKTLRMRPQVVGHQVVFSVEEPREEKEL